MLIICAILVFLAASSPSIIASPAAFVPIDHTNKIFLWVSCMIAELGLETTEQLCWALG